MKRIIKWMGSHRKQIIYSVLLLALLVATAGLSYKAGQSSSASKPKSKSISSLFNTDALKKAAENSAKTKVPTTNVLTTSSGFYRLNGTVQSISASSLTLKLTNGTIMPMVIKTTTPYYDGTKKNAISSLKKNTTVMTTGTIGADGGFMVTAIQKNNQ